MSYKTLEIWRAARELSIEIHEMSFSLPKFEQFEEAQQIRRSSKSVRSNIVEGYGRRRYKQDYIRFMVTALASNDETIDHLETLYETKSIVSQELFEKLLAKLQVLGKKLNNFIKAIEAGHNDFPTMREAEPVYFSSGSGIQNPESSIQYPVSRIK